MSVESLSTARPGGIRVYGATVVVILVVIVLLHPPVGVVGAMSALVVALARGFAQVQGVDRG